MGTLIGVNQCSDDILKLDDINYWCNNFSSSSYVTIPCTGWYSGNWEIQTRVYLNSLATSSGRIFSQKGVKSFELMVVKDTGQLVYSIDKTNTAGDNWAKWGNTDLYLKANTDTLINISYNGTNYITKICEVGSDDWSTHTLDYSDPVYSGGTNMIFGTSRDYTWYLTNGRICMSKTWFKKDGVFMFNGNPYDWTLNSSARERLIVG